MLKYEEISSVLANNNDSKELQAAIRELRNFLLEQKRHFQAMFNDISETLRQKDAKIELLTKQVDSFRVQIDNLKKSMI